MIYQGKGAYAFLKEEGPVWVSGDKSGFFSNFFGIQNLNFYQTLFYIVIHIVQLAKMFSDISFLPFVITFPFFSFPEKKVTLDQNQTNRNIRVIDHYIRVLSVHGTPTVSDFHYLDLELKYFNSFNTKS